MLGRDFILGGLGAAAIIGLCSIGTVEQIVVRTSEQTSDRTSDRTSEQPVIELPKVYSPEPSGDSEIGKLGTFSLGAAAGERRVWTADGIHYAFRWCPAETFTMGGTTTDEKPHSVTLTKGFWILETEVTQAMWESLKVKKLDSSGFIGDDLPVENVSWHECREFCKALSNKLNLKVDLPTEAQWEYACRAGTTEAYAGDIGAMAWYGENIITGSTHPVGKKTPNAWGLYDMHGNVWEWCSDWYGEDYYAESPACDPTGPNSGSRRVNRGGSWGDFAKYCRSAYRSYAVPDIRYRHLGFRIVLADPAPGK